MQFENSTHGNLFYILRRRKWFLFIPAVCIILGAAVIALKLPSVYKSTSTILIEQGDVPENFISGSFAGYPEQRIQSIEQKIKSSAILLEIIDRYHLFQEKREYAPIEQIIEKMRNSVKLNLISAKLTDRRTGRSSEAAIAFTISYEGKENPKKVQEIASGLTSMFLEENLQVRKQQTLKTTNFLKFELNRMQSELEAFEDKISLFKGKNIYQLPESVQSNIVKLNSIENQIKLLNDQLQSLKEKRSALQIQLKGVPSSLERQKVENRLDELRILLVDLRTRFSDEYPDVINTKTEIDKLDRQLRQSRKTFKNNAFRNDNPAYIALASELSTTQIEINSISGQIEKFSEELIDYQMRIAETPKIEAQYKALTLKRDNTKEKVNDLMKKLMEAQVAQGLERDQKGERLRLIEPAQLPLSPFKPNRRAILLVGLLFGVGVGIGLASIAEYADTSIRDAQDLEEKTSFPVLASIPNLK